MYGMMDDMNVQVLKPVLTALAIAPAQPAPTQYATGTILSYMICACYMHMHHTIVPLPPPPHRAHDIGQAWVCSILLYIHN